MSSKGADGKGCVDSEDEGSESDSWKGDDLGVGQGETTRVRGGWTLET